MDGFNPSGYLFPLARLRTRSTAELEVVMEKLALIYSKGDDAQVVSGRHGEGRLDGSLARLDMSLRKNRRRKETQEDTVVDSGYASAEEDETGEDSDAEGFMGSVELVRSDSFERDFTIRWLTGFIARSSQWIYPSDAFLSDEEAVEREALVEKAASLLSSCARVDEDHDKALSRLFAFPLGSRSSAESIDVELNDLIASEDHSSVGLQSWASSIHFARLMAEDPARFGIIPDQSRRILELGAGTGMLSIATAKIVHALSDGESPVTTEIISTDYHRDVLRNLQRNIASNLSPGIHASVIVHPFDWQHPSCEPPFDTVFDTILAADVVYHPCHADWIKNCVSTLLRKPTESCPEGGVFWMIIALRNIGRHEGLADAVFDVFPTLDMQSQRPAGELKVVQVQDLKRCEGVGRRDETGYRLLKICWT
ncbi:hypothetical protein ACEPAI_320 [Sanghuangporus weigelae]